MVRVQADRDVCIQAGNCVMVAGEVFDQDDDGIVVLLDAEPPAEHAADVRHAASVCPALAIHVEE